MNRLDSHSVTPRRRPGERSAIGGWLAAAVALAPLSVLLWAVSATGGVGLV